MKIIQDVRDYAAARTLQRPAWRGSPPSSASAAARWYLPTDTIVAAEAEETERRIDMTA